MAEYIERAALYNKIAALEELARNRYLDTPGSNPAYPRYHAQLNERTALKHLVADFPAAADVTQVVRCGECQNCLIDLSERARHLCMAGGLPKQVTLEDFCSFGERKEGGGNS